MRCDNFTNSFSKTVSSFNLFCLMNSATEQTNVESSLCPYHVCDGSGLSVLTEALKLI